MNRYCPGLACCLILCLQAAATNQTLAAEKIIIDTDPGVDDALAVLFALHSPEFDVLGITTIFGNVDTNLATANALRLVDLAGKSTPVAEGAVKPIYSPKLDTPVHVHGNDGFGNIDWPSSSRSALDVTAAEFIVATVMNNPKEVTIVVLGPMTNVALALALEPALAENVKAVVAMGGVIQAMGNVSPVASANILGDAHAADIVLGTDWNAVLVTADITRQVLIGDDWLERIRDKGGRQGEFIYKASLFYRDFYKSVGVSDGFYNHDSTAMVYVVRPDFFETESRAVRVVTDGMTIGEVVAAQKQHYQVPGPWYGLPLSKITVAVDSNAVLDYLESALANY